MKAIEKINAKIEEQKQLLKIANAIKLIEDYFEIRNEFDFTSLSGSKIELFGSTNAVFRFGTFDLSSNSINHFNDMHEISFDSKHERIVEILKIKKAVLFIEKETKNNLDNVMFVANMNN